MDNKGSSSTPIYAGEPHHIDFWVQNINPKELNIVAVDSIGTKVPVNVSISPNGKMGLDLVAPHAGNLSLRVLYGNDANSQAVRPIILDVLEKPVCKFSSEGLRAAKVARYLF
jgi:hypothetical protein